MAESWIFCAVASVWGVVCFALGFIMSVALRIADDKARQRLLSSEQNHNTSPHATAIQLPSSLLPPNSASDPLSVPQAEPENDPPHVPSPALVQDPRASAPTACRPASTPVGAKVFLFGDPATHGVMPTPPAQPARIVRPYRWPAGQETLSRFTGGTDILPHRVEKGRRSRPRR
jgi:hypothetical protein